MTMTMSERIEFANRVMALFTECRFRGSWRGLILKMPSTRRSEVVLRFYADQEASYYFRNYETVRRYSWSGGTGISCMTTLARWIRGERAFPCGHIAHCIKQPGIALGRDRNAAGRVDVLLAEIKRLEGPPL